jgi:Zn-finger protein
MKDVLYHKSVIEKCERFAKESPSDKVKRCQEGILYHQKQVEAHDSIVSERIRKIMEEGAKDKERKLQYLKEAEEKLERELSYKSRQQLNAETELSKVETELKNLLENENNYHTEQPNTLTMPLTQSSEPPKRVVVSSEWEQTMKAERELELLRANRPSYEIDHTIPKNETVYGEVSSLPPKPKKSIKVCSVIKTLGAGVQTYPTPIVE